MFENCINEGYLCFSLLSFWSFVFWGLIKLHGLPFFFFFFFFIAVFFFVDVGWNHV